MLRQLRLLAACVTLGATVLAAPAAAATPTADYRCRDSLASDVAGAPALTPLGSPSFVVRRTGDIDHLNCAFYAGSGFAVTPTTGTVDPQTYTIVALLALDHVAGLRRVLDFKHGTSDTGLYADRGRLRFVGVRNAVGSTRVPAGTFVQLVVTRAGNRVEAWLDRRRELSFADPSGRAAIDPAAMLRLFVDNTSGPHRGQNADGALARLRLFSGALTPTEIAALDRLPAPRLQVTPTSASPGADVTLTGDGFSSGESVAIALMASSGTSYGGDRPITDRYGAFSQSETIPGGVAAGDATFQANSTTSAFVYATAPFTVLP